MEDKKIPVLLLTGYLGSGKTTLLNRILSNKRGIKFAVIVNDIGEVNIDADLIEKGGIVGGQDDSLVALQNGCICCTLQTDLVKQLCQIVGMQKFDYIVIEASGICEPAPIAQTISSIQQLTPENAEYMLGPDYMELLQRLEAGKPVLDCIVTVVDALRMKDEFNSGHDLLKGNLGEEDIENLVIQQIEFCNIVLLNKAAEVEPNDLRRIHEIVRALQPKAEIIECNYGDVPFEKILNTGLFDFVKVATSATWIEKVEGDYEEEDFDEHDEHEHHHDDDDDEDEHEHHHHKHHHDDDDEEEDEHEHHHHHHHDDDDDEDEHEHHHHDDHEEHSLGHHHHHHHHHDEGEAEEYGIGTFVYYRRQPFDLGLFDNFIARKWPKNIIRAKGICYFRNEPDTCYVFEQAGKQVSLRNAGAWYATMPKDELEAFIERNPGVMRDWDDEVGDRMQKLVFIGQKLDKKEISELLDKCLW